MDSRSGEIAGAFGAVELDSGRELFWFHGSLAAASVGWVWLTGEFGLASSCWERGAFGLSPWWAVVGAAMSWVPPVQAVLFAVATCLVPGLWRRRAWWACLYLLFATQWFEIDCRQTRDFGGSAMFEHWSVVGGYYACNRTWCVNLIVAALVCGVTRCCGWSLADGLSEQATIPTRRWSIVRWVVWLCAVATVVAASEWLDQTWHATLIRRSSFWSYRFDAFAPARPWLPAMVSLLTLLIAASRSTRGVRWLLLIVLFIVANGIGGYCHWLRLQPFNASYAGWHRFELFWSMSTLGVTGNMAVTLASAALLKRIHRLKDDHELEPCELYRSLLPDVTLDGRWTERERLTAIFLSPMALAIGFSISRSSWHVGSDSVFVIFAWHQLFIVGWAVFVPRLWRRHWFALAMGWISCSVVCRVTSGHFLPMSRDWPTTLLLAVSMFALVKSGVHVEYGAQAEQHRAWRFSLANVLAFSMIASGYMARIMSSSHNYGEAKWLWFDLVFLVVNMVVLASSRQYFLLSWGSVLAAAFLWGLLVPLRYGSFLGELIELFAWLALCTAPVALARAFGYRLIFMRNNEDT
jgi:hypothetical protein